MQTNSLFSYEMRKPYPLNVHFQNRNCPYEIGEEEGMYLR